MTSAFEIYAAGRPLPIELPEGTDADTANAAASDASKQHAGQLVDLAMHGVRGLVGVARYRDGAPVADRWRVDFFAYLSPADHSALSKAGITFIGSGSEIGPRGELRSGYARNEVGVEAVDARDALGKVKEALAAGGVECGEWHVKAEWITD
ncbi:MAG: hypothetical protein ACHQC8_04445 [Solirubrobacterales bacterium]